MIPKFKAFINVTKQIDDKLKGRYKNDIWRSTDGSC